MAAPPPRPSARNAGARGGPSAQAGGGAARGGASHASAGGKGDKAAPTTFFLGRYRVVEEIGVGGMASVHLGRMDGPGGFQKWVAIKRIHPNLVEDDQFVDMFLDEARIAAGINHANVAQVFDLGKDEGTYWIAMEYLHGEPLRELMRRCEERHQAISCDIAARLCADAAEGLHAAHELRGKNGQLLGLVHRDVTPHNLFVTYEGYTKVVDFGIAKVADRLSETRAGTLKGKLAYMSPEQVRGQDDVDRTTDVFALGVVLWELTTGHRLFRMDTDLDTLEKVQACVVPPPSTIVPGYPIELESVVMKALAKKKPERYQTAREFSRSLQMYLQRRGVLIGPEEVSQFVRDMFADRIKQREAHLAWAADVTSTINIDQLNAMKANRNAAQSRDEVSLKSVSEADEGPRTMAMSADVGRPSVPGLGPPPIRQSSNGSLDPATPMHGVASRRAPPPPPPPTVPSSPAAKGPLSAGPMGAGPMGAGPMGAGPMGAGPQSPGPPPGPPPPPPGPQLPRAGSSSLMDDDEDVPTTVATREQLRDVAPGGKLTPGAPQPGPGAGGFPSIRSTTVGVGAVSAPAGPPQGPSPMNGAEAHPHAGKGTEPPPRMNLGATMAMPPGAMSPSPMSGGPVFGPPPNSQPGWGGPQGTQGLPQQGPPPQGFSQQGQPQQGQQGQPQQGHPQQGMMGPGSMQYPQAGSGMGPMSHSMQGSAPGFGPPPMQGQQGGPPSFGMPPQQQPMTPPPLGQMSRQGDAPAFGPPPGGAYGPLGQSPSGGTQTPGRRPPPSAIETALSLPRPDAASWGQAQARSSDRMSTAVLVAVAVLTAICVLALGALIYFRYRAAPTPPPSGSLPSAALVRSA